jgi:hypothetical protein
MYMKITPNINYLRFGRLQKSNLLSSIKNYGQIIQIIQFISFEKHLESLHQENIVKFIFLDTLKTEFHRNVAETIYATKLLFS